MVQVAGTGGNDSIGIGSGSMTLTNGGTVLIVGGSAVKRLGANGLGGMDTIDAAGSTRPVLLVGDADADKLTGGRLGDTISGGAGTDNINAREGTQPPSGKDAVNCGPDGDVVSSDEPGIDTLTDCESTDYLPNTSIVGGPGTTTDNTPTFSFNSNPPPAVGARVQFECSLDGGQYRNCTDPVTGGPASATIGSPLSLGQHTLRVRAKQVDDTNETDPTPAVRTFTIGQGDVDFPETHINGGPRGTTRNRVSRFSFSSDESNVRYECRLRGAGFVPCTQSITTAPLRDGAYTLEVRARDAAGNVDPTPAERNFRVDATGPTMPVTRLRVSLAGQRNIASVGLRCPRAGTGRCRGTVSLVANTRVRGRRPGGTRQATIGRKRFSIRAGRGATVRIRLSNRALRRARRVANVQVSVAARDQIGNRRVSRRLFLFR
jgi:hypothetical protein